MHISLVVLAGQFPEYLIIQFFPVKRFDHFQSVDILRHKGGPVALLISLHPHTAMQRPGDKKQRHCQRYTHQQRHRRHADLHKADTDNGNDHDKCTFRDTGHVIDKEICHLVRIVRNTDQDLTRRSAVIIIKAQIHQFFKKILPEFTDNVISHSCRCFGCNIIGKYRADTEGKPHTEKEHRQAHHISRYDTILRQYPVDDLHIDSCRDQ